MSAKNKDMIEVNTSSEVGKKERGVYAKVVDLWSGKEPLAAMLSLACAETSLGPAAQAREQDVVVPFFDGC